MSAQKWQRCWDVKSRIDSFSNSPKSFSPTFCSSYTWACVLLSNFLHWQNFHAIQWTFCLKANFLSMRCILQSMYLLYIFNDSSFIERLTCKHSNFDDHALLPIVGVCPPHTAKKFGFMYSQKRLTGLTPYFHIRVSVSDLYTVFPRSVHLFSCSRIGRPIGGIYKSLTKTWMYS